MSSQSPRAIADRERKARLKKENPEEYERRMARRRERNRLSYERNKDKYADRIREYRKGLDHSKYYRNKKARLMRLKEEDPEEYERRMQKRRDYNKAQYENGGWEKQKERRRRQREQLKLTDPEKYEAWLRRRRDAVARCRAKLHAGQAKPQPRVVMSEEERREKKNASSRKYYAALRARLMRLKEENPEEYERRMQIIRERRERGYASFKKRMQDPEYRRSHNRRHLLACKRWKQKMYEEDPERYREYMRRLYASRMAYIREVLDRTKDTDPERFRRLSKSYLKRELDCADFTAYVRAKFKSGSPMGLVADFFPDIVAALREEENAEARKLDDAIEANREKFARVEAAMLLPPAERYAVSVDWTDEEREYAKHLEWSLHGDFTDFDELSPDELADIM